MRRNLALAAAGGVIYFCLELLWRGRSHPIMVAVGGLCCLAMLIINGECHKLGLRFGIRLILSVFAILLIEFVSGVVINLALGMGVWDYSSRPLNLLGQVCPEFAALWTPLAALVLSLDDVIARRAFRGRHAGRLEIRTKR